MATSDNHVADTNNWPACALHRICLGRELEAAIAIFAGQHDLVARGGQIDGFLRVSGRFRQIRMSMDTGGGGNLCCYASTGQIGNDQPITSTAVAESLADLLPAMLPRLWVFSLRLTGNQHDAEDLVQAACARALEREHQLKPGTAPLSWMFSIVQSIWINELRARKVRQRSNVDWDDSMLNVADPSATPVDEVLFSREVIAAVERLPEAQRTVVLLVAVEGLSYAEAARVLDVPVGTIMSRLSRARQSIGEKFGKYSAAGTQEVTCEIGTAR